MNINIINNICTYYELISSRKIINNNFQKIKIFHYNNLEENCCIDYPIFM